mmetsp:Transcript_6463/g.20371  ORF Transcript_6463/g.20371 Transcript_6463/m.20371 type:complete len:287 (-) Transcript_6463:27-887(-)
MSDAQDPATGWFAGWFANASPASIVSLAICIAFGFYAAFVVANEPARDGTQTDKEESEDEAEPPRDFTSSQLRAFDGSGGDDAPIYVAIKGDVFDVSAARGHYGPGGGYALFAGHDASKCLATMSLEAADLDGAISTLNHGEREQLDEWHFRFAHEKCYPNLGRLAAPASDEAFGPAALLARGTGVSKPPQGRCCAEHLISVRGQVYDVGFGGAGFYGEGCSYHLFCGKDASRALAKMSFKPEDVDRGWPDLDDLDDKEIKILDDWEKLFKRKYPRVGLLDPTLGK